MPYALKETSVRGSQVLTSKYMQNLAETVNTELDNIATELQLPKGHFAKVSTDVHPLVISAARKFRILAQPVRKFADEIQNAHLGMSGNRYGRCEVKLSKPIMWASAKPDTSGLQCIAFLNLDMHSVYNMSAENPWTPDNCIGVSNALEKDLQHEDRKQAWLPFSRGRRRLNVRKSMSLTRVLARYVTINNNPIDPKTVDNLAQKMLDVYKPMQMYEANDIESMRKMYTKYSSDTPGSCMDSTHGFYMDRPTQPVDWYALCPNTKGYYVCRGDTVLARTIVNLNQKDNKWYYTRIYATRDVYTDELKNRLRDIDIVRADSPLQLEIKTSVKDVMFEIPPAKSGDNVACPFPYYDFVPASSIWIMQDIDAKGEKVIRCWLRPNGSQPENRKWVMPNVSSTNGSHVFGECDEYAHCSNCDHELYLHDDDYLRTTDGTIFCEENCAAERDYIRWQTSDNCEWRPLSSYDTNSGGISCVYDPTIFSNTEAAMRSGEGIFFYWHPWADTEGVCMRSRWANDAEWGMTTSITLPLHLTNPVTGNPYRGNETVRTCFSHQYRNCFGGYQELTVNGLAPKFLSIQGTLKRGDYSCNTSNHDFVKINKSKISKWDITGYEAGQVSNLFANAYRDFIGTDNALGCAETNQGVILIDNKLNN